MNHVVTKDPDSFDLVAPVRILQRATWRYRWLVLLTTAACLGATIAYMKIFPPVYKASIKVVAERDIDAGRESFYKRWDVFHKGHEGETEVELMKAAPVLEEVIDRLNLGYDEIYHPHLRVITDIWEKSTIGKLYRKIKYYFFPPSQTPHTLTQQEIARAKMVVDFQSGIQVEKLGNSNVGKLTVLGPTARVAQIANTLISVFLEYRKGLNQHEAMAAYRALTGQVEKARLNFENAQTELKRFSKENSVQFDFEKERNQVKIWADEEVALDRLRLEIRATENQLSVVNQQLRDVSKRQVGSTRSAINELKRGMEKRLMEQQFDLLQIEKLYSKESREVKDATSIIYDLTEKIKQTNDMLLVEEADQINPIWESLTIAKAKLEMSLSGLKASEKPKEDKLAEYKELFVKLPEKQSTMINLGLRLNVAEREYRELIEGQRQAYYSGLVETEAASNIKVVEGAVTPYEPSRPKPKLFLAGAFVVGIFLGICMALIAHQFDDRYWRERDLSQMLDLKIYGPIKLVGNELPNLLQVYPPLPSSSNRMD